MILPRNVKIGAYDYAIERWDPNQSRAVQRGGECDRMNKVIRVDTSFQPRRTVEILLHEVMHATWWEFGFGNSDPEERIIEMLSFALVTLAHDNPEFFAWVGRNAK